MREQVADDVDYVYDFYLADADDDFVLDKTQLDLDVAVENWASDESDTAAEVDPLDEDSNDGEGNGAQMTR